MSPPGRGVVIAVLALLLAATSWLAPLPSQPRTVGHAVGPKPTPYGVGSPVDAAVTPAPVPDPSTVPAPEPAAVTTSPPREVLQIPYRIELRTDDPAVADALHVIPAVLEDPRGWQQADISFVLTDDAPYTIVLAEGAEAQVLCQPYDVGGQFSCQNGPVVVLNAIRWREGVDHWPGDLLSYRTMLINHEVGHLIGMHHLRCTKPGAPAPVMEQQSGTLRGCQANAWPTPIELRLAATHQFVVAPWPAEVPFPP